MIPISTDSGSICFLDSVDFTASGGKSRTRKIDRRNAPGNEQDAANDWVLFHAGKIPHPHRATRKREVWEKCEGLPIIPRRPEDEEMRHKRSWLRERPESRSEELSQDAREGNIREIWASDLR